MTTPEIPRDNLQAPLMFEYQGHSSVHLISKHLAPALEFSIGIAAAFHHPIIYESGSHGMWREQETF